MKFIMSTLVLLCLVTNADAARKTLLSPYQKIHTIGSSIILKVKLEEDRLIPYRKDIANREVTFFHPNGIAIGKDVTNAEGEASVPSYVPAVPGNYFFKAVYSGDRKYKKSQTDILITVVDPTKKIVITDIDKTISLASGPEVVLKPNEKIFPLPKSPKWVNELAKDYQIVYVTARDDLFKQKTFAWLKLRGFPVGPTYFWDYSNDDVPDHHGEYKRDVIARIKADMPNIAFGAGDKPHDVWAYREVGIRAYYIGEQDEDIVPLAIRVTSWDQIMEHFYANPIGSLEGDPIF